MALLFVGKLLIALGLCYQAYTLFHNKSTATTFDSQLTTALHPLHVIPADIQLLIKTHLRLVVVGLLGFSALMAFFKTAILKIPILLGLLTLFWLRYLPLTAIPSFKDHAFWQLVSTIGGVIFLIGADHCHSGPKAKTIVTDPVSQKKPENKSDKNEKNEKNKGKNKHI